VDTGDRVLPTKQVDRVRMPHVHVRSRVERQADEVSRASVKADAQGRLDCPIVGGGGLASVRTGIVFRPGSWSIARRTTPATTLQ
jgi:hypothetical protein